MVVLDCFLESRLLSFLRLSIFYKKFELLSTAKDQNTKERTKTRGVLLPPATTMVTTLPLVINFNLILLFLDKSKQGSQQARKGVCNLIGEGKDTGKEKLGHTHVKHQGWPDRTRPRLDIFKKRL